MEEETWGAVIKSEEMSLSDQGVSLSSLVWTYKIKPGIYNRGTSDVQTDKLR